MKVRKRKKILSKKIWAAGAWNRYVHKVMHTIVDANRKMSSALYEAYAAARGQE